MKITEDDVRDILDINNFVGKCHYYPGTRAGYGSMCNDGKIMETQVVGKTPKGKDKTKDIMVECPSCNGTGYKLNQNGEALFALINNLKDVKENKKIYLPIKTGYDGY